MWKNKVAERADDAVRWEAYVAGRLARAGLQVVHNPFTLAESAKELSQYSNSVDLLIAGRPVEVKSKGTDFGPDPFEYPYPDILICASKSYANKWGEGEHGDFIYVSTRSGSLLWLPAGQADGERRVYDSRRKEGYCAKTANKEKLRSFADFCEVYRERANGGAFHWKDGPAIG